MSKELSLVLVVVLCLLAVAKAEKTDDHLLIDQWQDDVLGNALVANYLNILMVFASRTDFSLIDSSNSCTTYITNPNSFRQTISQLATNIRRNMLDVYQAFSRIHLGLERIPLHLKTTLLLIKIGKNDTINTNLPKLLEKGENIVNESLLILKNPQTKIEEVKNLLTELHSLISTFTSDNMIPLQIEDVETQWILLNDLFTQLAIQAEKVTNHFLLQFNWIIEQFDRLDIDQHRDLIINLLKPKAIEIDRSADLLSIISQTYVDISIEYSNIKITTNTNLIQTSTEEERKEIIKQHRYELQPEAVKIARRALKRQDEFFQRNDNREILYEKFLNEMTENDLEILLSLI
jgi:hypothetical protein